MLGLVSLAAAAGDRPPAAAPSSSAARPVRFAATAEDPATLAARAKLRENRPKLEFSDVRLDSVIDFFRDVTGLNVVANWNALQAAGIHKGTPITIFLRNVSNSRGLTETLSAAGGVVPLGYMLEKGVVRISTKADLATRVTHRVYNVADLVTAETARGRRQKADTLCRIVRAVVDHASWGMAGRHAARLGDTDALLVVSQNDANHTRVAGLLSAIRRRLTERAARAKTAAGGAAPPRPSTAEPESEANRAARAKLREIRPKLNFSRVRLDTVIDFYRDVTGLNVVLNWHALVAAGIDRSTAVSFTLSNVSNERALKEILSAAGGVAPLGYIVTDGIVRISTAEDLGGITTIRVYDVADLVAEDTDQERRQKTLGLCALVRRTVAFDSWFEAGGAPGRLCEFDGLLVVSHNNRNHARLAALLSIIRRKLDERAARTKVKTAGGATPPRPSAAEPGNEFNRAARVKLRANRPLLKFSRVRLDSAIDFLRDVASLNVVVNWAMLKAAGIDRRTAVSITLADVSNARALTEVLTAVGGVVPLGYVIEEGVVRISTWEHLDSITAIRIYDVADLVAADTGPGKRQRTEQLCEVIRKAIDRHSWHRNVGLVGSLCEFDGLLVVLQTDRNHARLVELLSTIRRKLDDRAARAKAGALPLRPPAAEPESEANRAARAKLREKRPKVEFSGVRLGSVIDSFRNVTGLNVMVNWYALQAAGTDKTAAITLTLHNVSNEQALAKALSAAGAVRPLGYILDEGIVRISMRLDLDSIHLCRVYDVADLVASDTPGGPGRELKRLRGLVHVAGQPDFQGGSAAMVGWFDRLVIFTGSHRHHARVAELLARLRR